MGKKTVLNQSLDETIKSYRDVLKTAGIPVERLILFGSRAKGQAKEWSDIDLCVVSPQFGRNSFEEMVELKKLADKVEPMIEPHPLHPDELNNRYDPLVAEVLAHGKIVG